jgi:Putative porin
MYRSYRLSSERPFRHRCTVLILATSWSVALPALAGRELKKEEALPASAPVIAAADPAAPVSPVEAADAALLSEPTAQPRTSPSQNVTINLINRMVARGLLPKEEADELIKQAEADAAEAKAQAAAEQAVAIQQAVNQAVAQIQASQTFDPVAAMGAEDAVRVTYIPEVVKSQLRDEIRHDVLAHARKENWVGPEKFPEWTSRIKLFGDVRVRWEGVFFPDGNANTGEFPNFNAINTGPPFDVSGTVFSPQLNVDQDRKRLRLRVRFGLEADLGNGFSAGLRIATGENNSPTSTNQSLGAAGSSHQGGQFSKYAIWLDRGFLKYEVGGQPGKNLALSLGRFDNPFFSTEIIWDDDIGFDGVALQAKYQVLKGFTPFFVGGAFPVYNTDFNFASNQPAKFPSDDKWLYAAQLGFDWKITKEIQLKLAAAYYDFRDIEGKLSDPFVPLTASDAGNTDTSRPSFAQKGNTYRAIRDIIPTVDNDFGTSRQFQYFGLATKFRDLAFTGRLDLNYFEPVQISLLGEFVKNTAWDDVEINEVAVNNRSDEDEFGIGRYEGGDTAWIAGIRVGKMKFEKAWDWLLGISYRHVESDAVVDGFVDSDFGGGGTNLEGYTLYGSVAISPNVALAIRWMSANELAGPPLKTDVLQIEVNGKF